MADLVNPDIDASTVAASRGVRVLRGTAAVAVVALAVAVVAAGRPSAPIAGTATVDTSAAAEATFPWRHLTVSSPSHGRASVRLDDGTGRPRIISSWGTVIGQTLWSSLDDCSGGDDCLVSVRVDPDLTVTATRQWAGQDCLVTGGTETPTRVTCRPPATPR